MEKKLVRSKDRMVAGVCAGLAEYFGLDVTMVRLLYAVATAISFGFGGIVAYIVCLIIMPQKA